MRGNYWYGLPCGLSSDEWQQFMFGTNPIRPPVKGNGERLDIQQIFPTMQGEGPFAGVPAVFVRLGGCNLACAFCDTEFESFSDMEIMDILAEVQRQAQGNTAYSAPTRLVVITGGEPLRQPIRLLCQTLLDAGFDVQIETNGTLWRELPPQVHVICSPKNPGGKSYAPVRGDVLQHAAAVKFIVSAQMPGYGNVPDMGTDVTVYVQPMDEQDENKNAANLKWAAKLAAEHGYMLSLQTHKIIGVE